jgi:hypothetical protein
MIENITERIKQITKLLIDVRLLAGVIVASGIGIASATWRVAEAYENMQDNATQAAVTEATTLVDRKISEHVVNEEIRQEDFDSRIDRVERSQQEIIRALGRIEGMLRDGRR